MIYTQKSDENGQKSRPYDVVMRSKSEKCEFLRIYIIRRPFILSLYGVSGVLIADSAHNCRYFDFIPSETIIFAILGHFVTLRTKNTINGPSATPQMAYGS